MRCEECWLEHGPDKPCLRGVLLVCGSRRYGVLPPEATPTERRLAAEQRDTLRATLDRVALRMDIVKVRHGCADGADSLAGRWARERGLTEDRFPAEWSKWGKAAGPKRNQRMVSIEPIPVVCVAFGEKPGSGTADMTKRCEKAGIVVYRVG